MCYFLYPVVYIGGGSSPLPPPWEFQGGDRENTKLKGNKFKK